MPPLPTPHQRSAYFSEFDKADPQKVMAYKLTRMLHSRLGQAVFATHPCLAVINSGDIPGTIDMLVAESTTYMPPPKFSLRSTANEPAPKVSA